MNLLNKLRRSYESLNIQTKFTCCIVLAVVVPILSLAVVFSNQLYDMIIADTIRTEQNASAQTAPLIDEAFAKIENAYIQLTEEDYYRTLFYQPINEDFCELSQTREAYAFSKKINELTSAGTIQAVRIYLDIPGETDFYEKESAKNIFLPISEAKGTYWYGIFQGSHLSSLYCPPFYLGNREIEKYGDSAYILSTTYYYRENAYPCYIALYYSSEAYQEILRNGISIPGSVSYIINDRESIIATTNDYLSGIYRLNYEDIKDSLMSSNNFIERSVLGEQVYVGFYYIKEPEWIMVTVLPSHPLIRKGNTVILKFIFICLLCMAAAIFIAVLQSRSITNRISSVIEQMSQVKKGPPVALPSPIIQDEVGELISTYNYMTEKMNLLIEQQKKTAEELRIAEFNSLQAQINPHFLYNTMDMINWMALKGHTTEVSNVIQKLARFYKLTLSRKKNFSTIEAELEHVSIYVELQNMRYQNTIDFVIDIPDELLSYSIPKLTLQPIVENAILHGILEKEEREGTIVITGWLEEEQVILLVSDDGVGIPSEHLPLILAEQPVLKTKGTNIAIYNIHKRLRLLYGEAYGLSYESTYGCGTEVHIRIPIRNDL